MRLFYRLHRSYYDISGVKKQMPMIQGFCKNIKNIKEYDDSTGQEADINCRISVNDMYGKIRDHIVEDWMIDFYFVNTYDENLVSTDKLLHENA